MEHSQKQEVKIDVKAGTIIAYSQANMVFLYFNPFLINISILILLKNILHHIASLVVPILMARPNNIVTPHALAR
jgi:hypothetical protein